MDQKPLVTSLRRFPTLLHIINICFYLESSVISSPLNIYWRIWFRAANNDFHYWFLYLFISVIFPQPDLTVSAAEVLWFLSLSSKQNCGKRPRLASLWCFITLQRHLTVKLVKLKYFVYSCLTWFSQSACICSSWCWTCLFKLMMILLTLVCQVPLKCGFGSKLKCIWVLDPDQSPHVGYVGYLKGQKTVTKVFHTAQWHLQISSFVRLTVQTFTFIEQ